MGSEIYFFLLGLALLFLAQVFIETIYRPARSDFWKELRAKYASNVAYDGDKFVKHFLYQLSEGGENKAAEVQFNGARYLLINEGLLISPPVFVMGGVVLLPWNKIKVGDFARIPITGWRFCKFRKVYVDGVKSILVIPEEVANQIKK